MEMIALEAQVRDTKISPLFLRKNRKVPGVYYGNKEKSISVLLDYQAFRKVYMKAGTNQIVELNIDGKKKTVLIHDVQFHPTRDTFNHVDFLHVNMNEEVTALIPIEITGVSPAVKDLGGVLTTLKQEIEVTCMPTNLPHSIQIDISTMDQLHSSIHLSDIKLPKEVKFSGDPEEVVLTISAQRAEEVEEAAPEVAAGPAAPAETPEKK